LRTITTRASASTLTWWTMPVLGGTTLNSSNAVWPQRRNLWRGEVVGDHRVVDDELGRRERVDLRRVAAEVLHRLAHGGEVDDAGHAGEVLHDHAGRRELDLLAGLGGGVPGAEGADLLGRDVRAVLGAQEVLEQHLVRERQSGRALDRVDPEDLVGGAADLEVRACAEAVLAGHVRPSDCRADLS
jgi:hypothetical protein